MGYVAFYLFRLVCDVFGCVRYTRVDPATAIKYYQHAVTIMCENGRFGAGAKNSEAVAELYEKDNSLQEAMKFYQQAANYYSADNSPSRSNKNLERVATIAATLADYKQVCFLPFMAV